MTDLVRVSVAIKSSGNLSCYRPARGRASLAKPDFYVNFEGPSRNHGCSFIALFRARDLSNLKPAVYCYRVSPACNNLGVNPKGPSCSVEDIRALESKTRNTNRLEDCHLSQRCPFCHGYFDSNVSGHPIYVSGVQRTCRKTS